eukprot:CAMPEP_0206510076 /NCGR_PEP_ID=MMETSP0324_2-20121206/59386_1 /ASSEMBLY_ACC=CAM_ASM_000836 /TAXON_ID=2866 /ORGANISM="Crypthecodinium cohnii, Strain Seligo" /LENGTH=59 /DNA_ID=CAMNT_0054001409 /DNA_START=86 /DNA_END=262 /DNA_ORIENTATION=+
MALSLTRTAQRPAGIRLVRPRANRARGRRLAATGTDPPRPGSVTLLQHSWERAAAWGKR